MRHRFRMRLCACIGLLAGLAFALPSSAEGPGLKSVAVIYFTGDSPMRQDHAAMVRVAIEHARDDMRLTVRDYPLAHENELAANVEKLADEEVGLIIIVEPHDRIGVLKLPGLYPDIHFSVIGIDAPLYMPNVESVLFNESEGVFLAGTLAALTSKDGTVGFTALSDDPRTRNLAYAFLQGAKYINPETRVVRQLGARKTHEKRRAKCSVEFVLDEALFEPAMRDARTDHHLVIPFNRDLDAEYPGIVLSSVLLHYDLALRADLKDYRQRAWKPGNRILGVGEGFIDYALDANNKKLLPKDTIDQVETTKDLLSQGIVKVLPLQE